MDQKKLKAVQIQNYMEQGMPLYRACNKVGMSKSSYYRQKKKMKLIDSQPENKALKALQEENRELKEIIEDLNNQISNLQSNSFFGSVLKALGWGERNEQ